MKTFNEWLKERIEIQTEGDTWDNWRPAAWLDGRVPHGWQKKIDQKYARELGGHRGPTGNYDAQGNEILSPEQQFRQQVNAGNAAYRQQQQGQGQLQPQDQGQQSRAPEEREETYDSSTDYDKKKRVDDLYHAWAQMPKYANPSKKQRAYDDYQRAKKEYEQWVGSFVGGKRHVR